MNMNFDIDPTDNPEDCSLSKSSIKTKTQKTAHAESCVIDTTGNMEKWTNMLSMFCSSEAFLKFFGFAPWLQKEVPIVLVSKEKLPNPPLGNDDKSVDTLGCYWPNREKVIHLLKETNLESNKHPVILISPEKIKETATKDNMDENLLCHIVIIHELAHAIMDSTNKLDEQGMFVKEEQQLLYTEADKYMEESLANMITLQYFEKVCPNYLDKVKMFVSQQPDAYKFGLIQYETIKPSWEVWRDNKSTFAYWMYWTQQIASHMKELSQEWAKIFLICKQTDQ